MNMLTQSQINDLPTLKELVQELRQDNQALVDKFDGWHLHPQLNGIEASKWRLPMVDFINDADPDKFIVVRTGQGRHTLKPNLNTHHYIYRGQSQEYPFVLSSFTRDDYLADLGKITHQEARDRHVLGNLRSEEFVRLLRTHPLFILFDYGIHLEAADETIFLNMNYHGLGQHYGFKSGVIDFTTELDAAAFFACTKYLGNDEYEPIIDSNGYGVIYTHQIIPDATFKSLGFSSIGLQLYPRTGAQRGLLFNEQYLRPGVYLHNLLVPHRFRHDADSSRYFFDKMQDGKLLFPADTLQPYAQGILTGNEISGLTFAENLYSNHDDLDANLGSLTRQGVSVNWNKNPHFEPDMIHRIIHDLLNDEWERFCNQIYFADIKNGQKLHDALLDLPNNPNYSHYFSEDGYYRIMAYEYDKHRRAEINALRH